jgi:integrase
MSAQLNFFDVLEASPVATEAVTSAFPATQKSPVKHDAETPELIELTVRPKTGARSTRTCQEFAGPNDHHPPATLLGVLQVLEAGDTRESRNIQMRSALKTFAKVVYPRLLADIPADPGNLGKVMAAANPRLRGVKKARWSSVCTLVRNALQTAGYDFMPARAVHPPSASWQALADQLPTKDMAYGLSRLLRHFTRAGIEPADVVEASFADYRAALEDAALSRPVETYRTTMRLWNAAAASVTGWPQIMIELAGDARRYSLDWAAFPRELRDDVETFLNQGGGDNPFERRSGRRCRPSTILVRRNMLRQAATGLAKSGFPIEQITGLRVLVSDPNGSNALQYLWEQYPSSQVLRTSQARLLASIARHYVGSEADGKVLAELAGRLKPENHGMTPKNRERIRQFDTASNVAALINLPARLMGRVRHTDDGARLQALTAMKALAVEILLHVPLRASNLFGLKFGENVIDIGGRTRRVHIVIPPGDAKTKKPYEVALSPSATRLLDEYVRNYRPRLCKEQSAYLFPSPSGGKRHRDGFARDLCRLIAAETGLVMNVHLFRHFAGYIILKENPQAIELVRQLLGHTSIKTTLRFYAEISAEHAADAYEKIIEKQRKAGPAKYSSSTSEALQ